MATKPAIRNQPTAQTTLSEEDGDHSMTMYQTMAMNHDVANGNQYQTQLHDNQIHSQLSYQAPDDGMSFGECCCRCCSVFWFCIGLPFSLLCSLRVLQEYERGVLFRVGRVRSAALGPGIITVMPCIDRIKVLDMRMQTYNVPPQEVLTKDSVTIYVDAVLYYRVKDANIAAIKVENYAESTQMVAMTTLRTVFGTRSLAEILTDREHVGQQIGSMLDDVTEPWGVRVERIEIKDIRLPKELQRAMAAEAEASREAKAKVVAAEGEQKASRALKEAADIIGESSGAMQLRYLQTLHAISAEKNSTILFPIPIEMMRSWSSDGGKAKHN